jgi:hypothetical protein
MAWPSALLAMIAAGLALPSFARTYCCNDDAGRRVCGDQVPSQCLKRGYQEYNAQGVIYKQHDAPLTAEQRAQRDAEIASKKELERLAADQARRDRALLASYSSAKDIDLKRDRALAEAKAGLTQVQARIEAALVRKRKLDAEAEFFQKKPMPESLKAHIRDNQSELAAHRAALDDKEKDFAALRLRFEEEKQRYLRLSQPASSATGR